MLSSLAVERSPQTIELLNYPECTFATTGLIIPPGMEFERWQQLGSDLRKAAKGIQFWIGDWIRYGEHEYGDRYTQAIQATGKDAQTLMNYVYVAEHVEISRRRENVDFSIHAEVASLPPKEQEKILSKAAAGEPTVRDVRREARRIKRRLNQLPDEVQQIHQPEAQAFLEQYIEELKLMREQVPNCALFLRGMIDSHIGQALWQQGRTVEDDCAAILDTFEEATTQTDDRIYKKLIESGHFMSDPDLDVRLELMSRHFDLTNENRNLSPHFKGTCDCKPENQRLRKDKVGGKKETQRGDRQRLYSLAFATGGDDGGEWDREPL